MPLLALVSHGAAPLAAFAGLCAAGLVLLERDRRLPALLAPAALFAAVLLWGALSAIWALEPLRSLIIDLRLGGLFLTGLALVAAADRIRAPWRMTLFLLAGSAIGIVIAGCDLATAGGLTQHVSVRGFRPARLDQLAIGLAILLLPASAALLTRGRRIAAFVAAAVAAAVIGILEDVSAKSALLASLPLVMLFCWRPRMTARVAAAMSVLFIVTAPLTLPKLERIPGLLETADAFKTSAGHRLLIWSFTGDRIAERPLLGWGLDSSRAIPGGNKEARPGQNWLPLHPHNAALQAWLELGVPGAALFAVFLALVWLRLEKLSAPRLYTAAACGSLGAALAPEFGAYGIWQEWWISTLTLMIFLILVMARTAEAATPPPRPGWRAGGR